MKSPVIKRSIVIAGHKTSVSLEDAFWKGLKEIADDRSVTLSDLVSTIDTDRRHGNLSSAIRLFVLDHYRNQRRRRPRAAVARDLIGMRRAGVSSARRLGRAARGRAAWRRRAAVGPRRDSRGFGAAGMSIGGGSAGACAPVGLLGVLGDDCRRVCRREPARGATAGSAGVAARRIGLHAASRAARSIASICRDCCSTARSVSQLVSRLMSTVRCGDGSAPFSAISTAGRCAPGDGGDAVERQPRIERRVGEDRRWRSPEDRRRSACMAMSLQARLPGADADRGRRPATPASGALSSTPVTNSRIRLPLERNAKLDRARSPRRTHPD